MMASRPLIIILGLTLCLHEIPQVTATPPINLRKLYESSAIDSGKFSKDDSSFRQPDEDVLELEQLKQRASLSPDNYEPINRDEALPALQKHLEYEAATKSAAAIDLGQQEEELPTIVQHRPSLSQSSSPPSSSFPPQSVQHPDTNPEHLYPDITSTSSFEKPSTKPFYGAARLAFGQNPEPVTSTSTTTPTTTTTSTNAIPITKSSPSTETTSNTTESSTIEKEAEDLLSSELEATKNSERRSVNSMSLKTAESLLKHKDGQYSSFDMAQYVFWTGDEAGVAHAVEEFIQQGLMSRENAIKFLKDIRLGIEYLQNSYNNRIFPLSYTKHGGGPGSLPSYMNNPTAPPASPPISSSSSSYTIAPSNQILQPENLQSTSNLQKTLEGIPPLFKLQEMSNSRSDKDSRSNIDTDEISGRLRLADFLYAEYSLEEVIYQLAKVMFSQSLTHGSEQSQRALRRLTEFLETEGEHGSISPNLQKKVLDVLLAALSDTLAEHPELLAAARSGLGSVFHKLPQKNFDHIKN